MEERSKKIVWGLSDLCWFDKGVEWKVGKGDKIIFWGDACGKKTGAKTTNAKKRN